MQTSRTGRPFRRSKLLAFMAAVAMVLVACGTDSADEGTDAGDATADAGDPGGSEDAGGDGDVFEIGGEVIADAELWAAAQEEGMFVWYTSLTEARARALLDEFVNDSGLNPELVRLVAVRLYERALSEHGSGVLDADVIMTTDLVLAQGLDEVFTEYAPLRWDELDSDLKGETTGYKWWIPMQSVNNIAYNSELVSEEDAPTSWQDLLDPRWADGQIVYTDAAGGSGWARELWLREEFGVEFWESMAAQNPIVEESAGNATDLLARGEALVAASLPGNIGQAALDGAPLVNVVPEEGLIAYNHHIGLVDGAQREASAKVFLNWLMSERGQEAVALAAGDYPVMSGAPGPVAGEDQMPSPDEGVIVEPSAENLVDMQEEWQREWFDIFGVTG